MKTDSSDVTMGPGGSPERALVDAAWRQFEKLPSRIISTGVDSTASLAIPGYRILGEVHRGGQGVVYQAIQESTKLKVAIKVLKHGPFADATEFARFDREIDVLSRLNHPHIVGIRDRGQIGGHAYYVMDFIPGRPLDGFVAGADLPVPEILELFAAICDAVNVAHLRGVIHRDLKPANIRVNEDGEPRILDFGLAKLEQESANSSAPAMTITGQFIGSLPWASPEQARGQSDSIDIRTDVYSLGVILYHLLTGRFPYPVSGQLSDIVRHISQTNPARPSTADRRVDHDLELIVLKCLAKEPERRYQSAGELARDIRRFLAHDPIEARPSSNYYHFKQFVRRHKTLAASVIAIFIILATATAGTTWALIQSRESNERATAINDFMREVLTSVDPETGAADVRLTVVMASASASASERFSGQPLQEAEVRDLLGQVYCNLSLGSRAKTEFERALALWREHAGPDDPRTLETAVHHLANTVNMSRLAEAEKLLEDLMPRLERVFGPDDIRMLNARRDWAITLMFRDKPDEAEHILLDLRSQPALAGADQDADTLQIRVIHTLNSITLRRAMELDPGKRAKILREIEPLARERLERATRRYGPDSPDEFRAKARLAQIVCGLGRFQAAVDLCREVLDRSTERLGECHYIRTDTMNILSEALTGLRESREPAELRLHEVACSRARLAVGDPVMLSVLSDALRYLERAGQAAAGEGLARELVDSLQKFGGGHGDMYFDAESFVARFISMQDRVDEAGKLFESLSARESMVQSIPVRARFHLFRAHHFIRLKDFERARRSLDSAVELTGDARSGTWETHPDDIVLGFIALHEAMGSADKIDEDRRLRDEAWSIAAGVNSTGD